MIKVNLYRQGTAGRKKDNKRQAAQNSGGEFTNEISVIESDLRRGMGVRLIILVIFPIALFVYQDSVIPEKATRVGKLQTELDEVSRKNRDAQAAVEEIKKFEKDQDKLQVQINTLNALRRDRIKEVRVLDYIQREIPTKVWLTRMELVEGRIQIAGMATADTELTTFMETLQRSAYLKDVNLVRSDDATVLDVGTVKRFEISCMLEKSQ